MTDTRERHGKRRRDVPQHSSETANKTGSDQREVNREPLRHRDEGVHVSESEGVTYA
jgi:hypothetical protein